MSERLESIAVDPASSGRALRSVAAHLVLGDDNAQVEDSRVRVGVVADTPALGQNLVKLDSHGPSRERGRHKIMKRDAVVLRCDR